MEKREQMFQLRASASEVNLSALHEANREYFSRVHSARKGKALSNSTSTSPAEIERYKHEHSVRYLKEKEMEKKRIAEENKVQPS